MSLSISRRAEPARPARDQATVIRTVDDLAGLADRWDHRPPPDDNPIASLEWALAAVRTVDRAALLHAIPVADADAVVAVAPFVRQRRRGVERLLLAGAEQLYEPGDLLARSAADLDHLCRQIAGQPYPVELTRIPADSPTVAALSRAFAGRGIVIRRQVDSCAVIPLNRPDTDAREASHYADLRRTERRVKKLGGISTEILTPRENEIDILLDEAYAIEARSWKQGTGTALALDQDRGAFVREYARLACRRGVLRIAFLVIEGRRVAMHIAMEHAGGWWALKVGYDAEYRRFSPGSLLWRNLIRQAEERGLRSFEFLGIFDAWKRDWTSGERRCVSIRAYPRSVPGLAALLADGAAALTRRLKR